MWKESFIQKKYSLTVHFFCIYYIFFDIIVFEYFVKPSIEVIPVSTNIHNLCGEKSLQLLWVKGN